MSRVWCVTTSVANLADKIGLLLLLNGTSYSNWFVFSALVSNEEKLPTFYFISLKFNFVM